MQTIEKELNDCRRQLVSSLSSSAVERRQLADQAQKSREEAARVQATNRELEKKLEDALKEGKKAHERLQEEIRQKVELEKRLAAAKGEIAALVAKAQDAAARHQIDKAEAIDKARRAAPPSEIDNDSAIYTPSSVMTATGRSASGGANVDSLRRLDAEKKLSIALEMKKSMKKMWQEEVQKRTAAEDVLKEVAGDLETIRTGALLKLAEYMVTISSD